MGIYIYIYIRDKQSGRTVMNATTEAGYVLGTEDKERERLQMQHDIWKSELETLLSLSGFRSGQTLIDLGCGPGYTSFALSEIVGSEGKIIAVDVSSRYLSHLKRVANERGINNIVPVAEDVQQLTIEENCIDGALARWLLAYIPDPQAVVSKIARALKPGGTFCVIDYFNHDAVMVGPRSDLCDKVFRSIHESVRDSGGDFDVGDRIPQYMHNAGLEIVEIRPISGIGRPGTQLWNCITMFLENYLPKVVDSGHLSSEDHAAFTEMWSAYEKNPSTFFSWAPMVGVVGRRL